LVINRTLVYGLLTLIVAGLYVLVVGGLGVMFQPAGNLALSLIGVGLVALVAQPVRERLQNAVNRLMYGERDDPYAVLSRLSQRLEDTLVPVAILPTIVETVARALKVPYAVIEINGERSTVSQVEWKANPTVHRSLFTAPLLTAPLVFQSENLGHLRVAPRAPDEAFSAADRRLLEDLARQAGAAAQAVRLAADLQHSREQLVTAREEERRRLRRDLHDGLGSQFAALHLRADTLRALIQNNPSAAEAVAIELRDEIRAAVTDIRRLVYELRPPALDELGLTGAMRALAAQRTSANGLQVLIDAPEPLPPLPAAVEVAAYRITQEALTNVVRHANANTCHIQLALADDLRLEIRDDGIGLPSQPHTGVGLRSMRERAAELGGTFRAETNTAGGTRLITKLPLLRVPNG
jgi:signal transduction histidine kinase